jgi:hypothetical protein
VQDATTIELRRQARQALADLRQRKNLLRARFALDRNSAGLYEFTITLGEHSRTLHNVKGLKLHDQWFMFNALRACGFEVATPSESEWLRVVAAMLRPLQLEAA